MYILAIMAAKHVTASFKKIKRLEFNITARGIIRYCSTVFFEDTHRNYRSFAWIPKKVFPRQLVPPFSNGDFSRFLLMSLRERESQFDRRCVGYFEVKHAENYLCRRPRRFGRRRLAGKRISKTSSRSSW